MRRGNVELTVVTTYIIAVFTSDSVYCRKSFVTYILLIWKISFLGIYSYVVIVNGQFV